MELYSQEGCERMKKRIIQIGIVIGLVCIYLLYIQFNDVPSSKPISEKKQDDQPIIYSLKHIVNVLDKHKIKLTPDKKKNPEEFKLNNVTPTIYTLNNNKKRNLFIYVFSKVSDRKDVAPDSYPGDFYTNFFDNKDFLSTNYVTWNVLMVETFNTGGQPPKTSELMKLKELHIDQIVFKDLNNGKVKYYNSESDHWKGEYTLKYYDHQWVDEKGISQIDQYGIGEIVMHYKPKNKAEVGKFEVQYELGSGSGSVSGEDLDSKGNFTIDQSSVRNGALPRVTVKWNGQEETILFKEKK